MPFPVIGTLREGVSRTVKRNGLLLVGLYIILGVVNAALFPDSVPDETAADPLIPLPLGLALLMFFLILLANTVLYIGAIRTFVTEETEELPLDVFTRNLPLALIHLFVATILFSIAVGIGLLLLIIPGLFLLTALFFYDQFVIVEDNNFWEGLQNSWSLTSGNRIRLFGLGVLVVMISAVTSAIFGLPGVVLGPFVGALLLEVGLSILAVFFAATTARAYTNLQTLESEPEEPLEPASEPDLQ